MVLNELKKNGFVIIKNAIDDETIRDLTNALTKLKPSTAVRLKNQTIYGVRNLLNLAPAVCEFSKGAQVRKIVRRFLGQKAQVVRAIFFDKMPEANWKVPWHQDLTIAVKEQIETEGFSVWTKKTQIHHVQPPVEILERMLTLRFHLDDADETNGALKVIPASHRAGRLSADQIKFARQANETHLCRVKKGDCLVMHPLILHSSSAGTAASNRRVIHFELANENLPNGLNWYGS